MFGDGSEKISVLEEVDDSAEGCVDGDDLAHDEEIPHEREGAALQENLACRLRVRDSRAGRQAESVDVQSVILQPRVRAHDVAFEFDCLKSGDCRCHRLDSE
jgi:hypothetical protein